MEGLHASDSSCSFHQDSDGSVHEEASVERENTNGTAVANAVGAEGTDNSDDSDDEDWKAAMARRRAAQQEADDADPFGDEATSMATPQPQAVAETSGVSATSASVSESSQQAVVERQLEELNEAAAPENHVDETEEPAAREGTDAAPSSSPSAKENTNPPADEEPRSPSKATSSTSPPREEPAEVKEDTPKKAPVASVVPASPAKGEKEQLPQSAPSASPVVKKVDEERRQTQEKELNSGREAEAVVAVNPKPARQSASAKPFSAQSCSYAKQYIEGRERSRRPSPSKRSVPKKVAAYPEPLEVHRALQTLQAYMDSSGERQPSPPQPTSQPSNPPPKNSFQASTYSSATPKGAVGPADPSWAPAPAPVHASRKWATTLRSDRAAAPSNTQATVAGPSPAPRAPAAQSQQRHRQQEQEQQHYYVNASLDTTADSALIRKSEELDRLLDRARQRAADASFQSNTSFGNSPARQPVEKAPPAQQATSSNIKPRSAASPPPPNPTRSPTTTQALAEQAADRWQLVDYLNAEVTGLTRRRADLEEECAAVQRALSVELDAFQRLKAEHEEAAARLKAERNALESDVVILRNAKDMLVDEIAVLEVTRSTNLSRMSTLDRSQLGGASGDERWEAGSAPYRSTSGGEAQPDIPETSPIRASDDQ